MNDESRETERDGGIPFYFPPLLFNTDNMEHSFYVDDVVGQGNKCGLLTRHLLSFSRLFFIFRNFLGDRREYRYRSGIVTYGRNCSGRERRRIGAIRLDIHFRLVAKLSF